MANKIEFQVGFNVDKNSYKQLEDSLNKVIAAANNPKVGLEKSLATQLKNAGEAAKELKNIMNQSWDSKLNEVNLTKLNSEFQNAKRTATQYWEAIRKGGREGIEASDAFARSILNSNIQLKESNKLLDRMAVTFKNTVRYGISSSIFNTFTNSIQKAYNYTKNLDTSLNDIRIVSGQSAEQMERLAISANKAAQALGKTTLDYTKAATIYYQQGLSSDEVEKRTEATLKAANVTGQNAREVSEQLTAVWNGYRVTGKELELYVDKLAAVAAHSASNLEELSTGMSKVASAANVMGVDIDQLTAQMSTIISVTRQAPESVGTALRTIYARIADIKAGLDDETSLGNYSGKMAKLGFNVLDASGNLKDMGDVIEEVGSRWSDLTEEQRISLAQTMAGTRQYNNLLTLFNNWDKYQEALEISANAAGTLQKQQDIYMESTEAHLQQLTAEAEQLYATLFDQDAARAFIDILKDGLGFVNNYVKSLGGGVGTLLGLGSQVANIFSTQIAGSLDRSLTNLNKAMQYNDTNRLKAEMINQYQQEGRSTAGAGFQAEFEQAEKMQAVRQGLTAQQEKEYIENQKNIGLLTEKLKVAEAELNIQTKTVEKIAQENSLLQKMVKEDSLDLNDPQNVQDFVNERRNIINDPNRYGQEEIKAAREELKVLLYYQQEYEKEVSSNEAKIAIKEEVEARKRANEEMRKQAQQQQELNSVIRGLSAAISLLTTATSVFNTISDENLTFWEKFKTVTGTLVMQLPLLIRSFQDLMSLGPNLTKVIGRVTASLIGETAATNGASVAMAIFQAICGNPLALGIAIAAITALTAALVVGIATLIDANTGLNYYNKKIEETTEKVNKAKEAYEELNNSIKSYSDAKTALDGMTEGTVEYYEAVLKANEAAQELIDTLGLLAGRDYSVSDNGLLQINEDVLKDRQFKAQQKIYQAQILNTQARIDKANYNRQEAINGLIGASEKKTGYTRKLTQQGAEDVLNNRDVQHGSIDKGWASKLYGDLYDNLVYEMINGVGHADLTEDVGQFRPVYLQAVEEAKSLKRQLADELIRGYASQAEIELYNTMTSEGKKAVQDYVSQYTRSRGNKNYIAGRDFTKDSVNTLSDIPFLGDIWKWMGETYANAMTPSALGTLGSTLFSGYGTGSFFAKTMQDKQVRTQRAKQMGYKYEPGLLNFAGYGGFGEKWIEESTGRDVTKEVQSWDADQIINEERLGTKYTEEATKKIQDIYNKSLKASEKANLGTDSQKHIGAAMMAMVSGADPTEIFKLLTKKDRSALEAQINASEEIPSAETGIGGLTENTKSKEEYLELLGNTSINESARAVSDMEAYNTTLADQAEQLGTTKKALELYGAAMVNADEITKETNTDNAEAIANSYKFNKAYNQGIKAYNNNIEALKKYTKAMKEKKDVDYETADAVAEIATELDNMGLKLSAKSIVKYANEIKKLFTGTEKEAQAAYDKLSKVSQIDTFENMFGEKFATKNKEAINTLVDDINNISIENPMAKTESEVGASLQKIIGDVDLTQKQLKQLEEGLGIKIPVTYDKEKAKELRLDENHFTTDSQVVEHFYDGDMPVWNPELNEGQGGWDKSHIEYSWTETTTPRTDDILTPSWTELTVNKKSKKLGGNFAKADSTKPKGKKGSTAKPSKKDPNKDELDRYQLVNVQLKEISKELTKLDKQKKKLLGGDLVKNLNKQINYLNDQISVTEAKLKIAEKERAEKAKTLSGYGAKFDEQGNVYNYETIFKQEQARLNKVYAKYNKMSKAQQEKYESTVKSAEERFKKFNDTISRYNTLNSDIIPGLGQDIVDAQDKITEDLIEEFNMEIKVRLDLAEAKREWNEFTRKYLKGWKENDVDKWASGVIDDLSLLINGSEEEGFGGTLVEATNQLSKFQEEFEKLTSENKAGDWYRDNAAQFKEDWKNAIEDAQEEYKRLQEAQDKMNEYFLQAMNLTQEKFDEQLDNFEAINKQIEHNLTLIDLLYGEDSYDKIEEQQRALRDNSIDQLIYLKQQKDYYDDLLATLDEEDEAWQEAKEGAQAANEALVEGLTNALEKAKEAFESGVAAVIKDMTDNLTNGKGFDLVNKQWELMNENSQLELDNINRMQGLQDIAKKYNDAINNTSNVKAQKELAEIRDKEIEQLKEIDHLSQEDLERAEKKLEIAKAQIALEDAQQNKTQMRLRRDSQGNYRYQFVANEDQVNQARDQLAAAYNSLYNFDKQRALQNNQEMINTTQKYFEEIANLRIRYGDDEEKYKEEKRILDEQYNEKMAILEEHRLLNQKNLNESTFADLNNLYAQNANNYELMTDAQKAALNSFEAANQTAFDLIFGLETENTEAFRNMADEEKRAIEEELIPQWNSGVDEMIRKLTDEGGFEQVATRVWDDITEKIKDYFEAIEAAEETSGRTFEELLGSENSIINQNKEWIESNKDLIQTFIDMTGSVEEFYNELSRVIESYGDIIEKSGKVIETNQNLYDQFTTGEADSIRDTLGTQPTTGGTGAFNQPVETTPTTTTKTTSTKPSIPFDGTLPKGTQLYNASGGKYNKTQAARTVTVTAAVGSRYQVWGSTFNPHTVYIDKNAIKYDTGGYTGEWGNGGRLALLHQKELVLNRKDTANMLNAVEVLRGITDSIGADLLGRMAGMTAGGFNSTVGGNALEQSVHIEATFPGVKSSIEIQDALNNLVNMAAQRAQIR